MTNNENKNFKKRPHNVGPEVPAYGFYSRILNKPFDSVAELQEAEAAHFAELRAREDKAAAKKADAQKVEDAFKALNTARKAYKENLTQLTAEYSDALAELKKTFEHGKIDIHNKLAAAETAYQTALKEFTDKYESYHLTLKDGDFETTIESKVEAKQDNEKASKLVRDLFDAFDMLYRF
jgi:uncharacterized protein YihD (DUF1040 family)